MPLWKLLHFLCLIICPWFSAHALDIGLSSVLYSSGLRGGKRDTNKQLQPQASSALIPLDREPALMEPLVLPPILVGSSRQPLSGHGISPMDASPKHWHIPNSLCPEAFCHRPCWSNPCPPRAGLRAISKSSPTLLSISKPIPVMGEGLKSHFSIICLKNVACGLVWSLMEWRIYLLPQPKLQC